MIYQMILELGMSRQLMPGLEAMAPRAANFKCKPLWANTPWLNMDILLWKVEISWGTLEIETII